MIKRNGVGTVTVSYYNRFLVVVSGDLIWNRCMKCVAL
jgi:hypothetical protein